MSGEIQLKIIKWSEELRDILVYNRISEHKEVLIEHIYFLEDKIRSSAIDDFNFLDLN